MEIRTGVDIIEVNRIKESIEQIGQVFVDRIFTEKEQLIKSYKLLKSKFRKFSGRNIFPLLPEKIIQDIKILML